MRLPHRIFCQEPFQWKWRSPAGTRMNQPGMPLIEGREFSYADAQGRPGVVIVNETVARNFWPNQSALVKRIGTPGAWLEIVIVLNDCG